jgi:hypothetical protein
MKTLDQCRSTTKFCITAVCAKQLAAIAKHFPTMTGVATEDDGETFIVRAFGSRGAVTLVDYRVRVPAAESVEVLEEALIAKAG